MDGESLYYEHSFLNGTCELLSDVKQPSFSSLNDSVSSEQNICHPTKEESFSDSEAVRNMLTSTPHRNSGQRRSVSLIDVSKIDEFSNRPFCNMLWETMGSQSSVGKSRDSGYIHSGSLLSVNSALKQGSEQVSSVLDECNRLKKELEFSEVLINSLQESNNQLRMKCAAASNRIFELRLKCANRCDCCSKQSSRSVAEHVSVESTSVNSSDSSCSGRSRSSSPETRSLSYLDSPGGAVFSPRAKAEEVLLEPVEEEGILCENGLEPSDKYLTNLSTEESSVQCQSRFHRKHDPPKSFLVRRSKSPINPEIALASDVSSSTDEELDKKVYQITLDDKNKLNEKLDILETGDRNNSQLEKFDDSYVSQNYSPPLKINCCFYKEKLSNYSESCEENHLDYSNTSSTENLLDSAKDAKVNLSKEEPIFVANEKNGKFWVGSFRVWGDSSIRVTPVNKLLSKSSSDEVGKVTFPLEKVEPASQMSDSLTYDNDLKKTSNLMLSATPPSIRSKRPVSAYSFPDNSKSRRTTLPGHYRLLTTLHCSPNNDNVKISVRSKSDGYKISQYCYSTTSPISKISKTFESPPNLLRTTSSENNNGLTESSLNTNDVNACNNNLSNTHISTTESPSKNICPDLVLEKWNGFKSKLNRLSLGSFISSDSNNKFQTHTNHPNLTAINIEDRLTQSSLTKSPENSCSTQADPSTPSAHPDHLSNFTDNCQLSESQSMEECLAKASDYANQISQGLARLPECLEHIRSIGRTET